MTTESQQQIAREAREDIHHTCVTVAKSGAYAILDCDRTDAIILSAIERATEFYSLRWKALQRAQHDMRDPERKMVCDILANGSTSSQPQRSDEKQQEWTLALSLVPDRDTRKVLEAAHNAALAAERQ